ncbi:PCOLCE2 [Branchiostoma lanceolatum]|uniref:PCOLCE2 protein n=2 Tax=Branchiostoma lanceolatum TaxID=7740 RepID=A0A8K0AGH9_BRALA|nr:PCOLCE2 [Branchiostoma lanceolatum]
MGLVAILMILACLVNLGVSECENGGTFRTQNRRKIKTDNHPASYPREPCTWTLEVSQGSVVLLTFDTLDIWPWTSRGCTGDSVTIYDGDSQGTKLGEFCGAVVPPALLSTGNNMTVVMEVGNYEAGFTGFSATFERAQPGWDSGCNDLSSWTQSKRGAIASMFYGAENYVNDAYCRWTITVVTGKSIRLTFPRNFEVETALDCSGADNLMVSANGMEIGTYCGSSKANTGPSDILSCFHEMTVEFTTDSVGTLPGFIAEFFETDCLTTTTVRPGGWVSGSAVTGSGGSGDAATAGGNTITAAVTTLEVTTPAQTTTPSPSSTSKRMFTASTRRQPTTTSAPTTNVTSMAPTTTIPVSTTAKTTTAGRNPIPRPKPSIQSWILPAVVGGVLLAVVLIITCCCFGCCGEDDSED